MTTAPASESSDPSSPSFLCSLCSVVDDEDGDTSAERRLGFRGGNILSVCFTGAE